MAAFGALGTSARMTAKRPLGMDPGPAYTLAFGASGLPIAFSGGWDVRKRIGRIDTNRCPLFMLTGDTTTLAPWNCPRRR
jgi:hypothetical protein